MASGGRNESGRPDRAGARLDARAAHLAPGPAGARGGGGLRVRRRPGGLPDPPSERLGGDHAARLSPGAKCNDGYTAFCCEIEHGRNACPENTYVAGWWKCTDYEGSGLCHGQGHRYYLDCNRVPGRGFPGRCQCANGDCGRRRVDCNRFRYGQCNPQVSGTTEVVCRLVICQHPAHVPGLNCNSTEMVDNNTCAHEADCLQGLAIPVGGGGGA